MTPDSANSPPRILTDDSLPEAVAWHRQKGQTIVFTNGCFDVIHIGHVRGLQEAAQQGDVLIVGLNSDAGVRRLKGPERPVIPQEQRAEVLSALRAVGHVIVFEDETPLSLIRAIRPDVLVKGSDYSRETIAGADEVLAYGGRVHLTELVSGVSTTLIVRDVTDRALGKR